MKHAPILLLLGILAPSPAVAAPQDAPPVEGTKAPSFYRPGQRVRDVLTLDDVRGQAHTLLPRVPGEEGVAGGTVTVLVFWSLRDPTARAYVPKLEALQRDFAGQKVELYLVDSNHDEIVSASIDPLERIRTYLDEEHVTLPVLVDTGNRVADLFGAVAANHAFLIDADCVVQYVGAIDDDPQGKAAHLGREVRHLLRQALEATLRGETPDPAYTRPSGRPIKRAPPAPGPPPGKQAKEKGSPGR